MDFGSSHVFTQADSETEELTAADFESQYAIYQPLGSSLSVKGVSVAPPDGGKHLYNHLDGFKSEHSFDNALTVALPPPTSDDAVVDDAQFQDKSNAYDVLYDNVIRDQQGTRAENATEEPVYDNRGFKPKPKPSLPERTSGDYSQAYDMLNRHPYEYAGPGSFIGDKPPPLPPMRKTGKDKEDMGEPVYGGFGEGQYQALLRKGSSKVRRADTNIVAVKFDKLVQSENPMVGSPVLCGCCGAAMSHLSKISSLYSGKFWICEFCEFENPIAEEQGIPITEDSTYVMGQRSGSGADSQVIFCIDVSGSMAVTTEVSGSVDKRMNDEQMALKAYQEELDAAEERSRQAQQEAYHAEMVANYEGTIEEQAQAFAQFQISRTQSTASTMSNQAPSVPPHDATVNLSAPAAQGGVAQTGAAAAGKTVDVEERYTAAPRKPEAVGQAQGQVEGQAVPQVVPQAAPQPPKRPVSYVSRLQAMQSAIEQQVAKLQAERSQTRVGLVAFNNNVTVIGDGSLEPVPLEGAGLTDKDSLISLGQMFPLPGPISVVHRCLTDKIYSLTESGQTALGPALLIAISMAAQNPGSKVIMCTDGMANVGLGALHNMEIDSAYEEAATFYEEVGNFARDSGVCVNVLTLEGEDCRAIELGSVADKTRGQVSIVQPNDLNQQFADILADPVLATNVSAKMVLHKGLFLRDADTDNPESQATHLVGLVNADSETTFEFGVRRKEVIYDNYGGTTIVQRDEEEPIYEAVNQNQTMIDDMERLPFQVQIRYTGRDGQDYLRILTMERPITKDRKFAEQNADIGVIGAHAAQSAARLAVEGNYAQAQINAIITQKLVQRCAQPGEGEQQEGIYQTFMANMAPINSEITRAHQLEAELDAGEYMQLEAVSDDEADDVPLVTRKSRATKKMKERRKNVSDHQASVFYRMKGATTKMFNKQTYSLGEVV